MTPEAIPDPIAVAAAVAGTLERIGVAYVIGGSFASSLHGEPRSTNDIDLVADLPASKVAALVSTLGSAYYVNADAVVTATGPRLFVDTPENVVLRKLEWFRRGGGVSERQWRDVVGVLRAQKGRLDEGYLEDWASRLGVGSLLRQASSEASQ